MLSLREIRESRNISPTRAALDLGITEGHVRAIELGLRNPSKRLMRRIADYYDLDANMVYELFIGESVAP